MRPAPIAPGPGQESVWAYPRPPRLEASTHHIVIVFNGETIADTRSAYRVLETSHPPTYYLPPADLQMQRLQSVSGSSLCEWKGQASYYDLLVGARRAQRVAWTYHRPSAAFAPITGYLAFYAAPMDRCTVDGEIVRPQPGGFYGGWVTSDVVGPFKGEPGTMFW